ncbi:sulfatase [Isosphaera pallida ATCC 43644]|uniref:Sulfatase n=1 Tax=Isosphaera pallida (strain ATCC 43644 / DSM 9630 / IS1B) TaxID=575540 RepID=E8QZA6_ISOPI|nr:sulfatase-like hydrolase/transferase [Isosphaera pallida]ADV64235.1 sulfatase [Isosphaera pallida ATCC 43644]
MRRCGWISGATAPPTEHGPGRAGTPWWFRAAVGIVTFVAAAFPCPAAGSNPPPPALGSGTNDALPHIVLIMTDDLGYADLGCYGAPDIATPRIDSLARDGARLSHFHSPGPVCTPTRAALLTGRWPQRVGLEWALSASDTEPGLPVEEPILSRPLKEVGYRTVMVGKWHLGYRPEFGPNAHGFDEFFGLLSGNVDHYSHREINGKEDWYENTKPVRVEGYSTDLLSDRAVAAIQKTAAQPPDQRQPLWLYVAYNAVHWPFQPPGRPQDIRDRSTWFNGTRADYVKMVESIDAGVGRILDALEAGGMADHTLVIFTNDNGGERLSDNGPFFHHKGTVWEGGHRVPCLIRWPGRIAAGTEFGQPTIGMDLTATILAAAKIPPNPERPLDGVNLVPILRGEVPCPDRALFWRIDRPNRKQKAALRGRWKYVVDGSITQLFDLEADPGERRDLAYRFPEVARDLQNRLARWEAEMNRAQPRFIVK